MKRIIILSFAIVSTCLGAHAQSNSMNKQVEVTKDYMPDVERATKLYIEPKMVDTVTLRPQINYSITPTAWLGALGLKSITPVRVQNINYVPDQSIYSVVGLGYPFSTKLDLYAIFGDMSSSYHGFVLNHAGDHYKIKNDLGDKRPANMMTNNIDVFKLYNSGRFWLGAQVGVDYDLYTPYAGLEIDDLRLSQSDMIKRKYTSPNALVWLGNDFTDMTKFNIRGYVDYSWFSEGKESYADHEINISESILKVGVDMGKNVGRSSGLMLKGSMALYDAPNAGVDSVKNGYSNSIVTVAPSYLFSRDKMDLRIGLEFLSNSYSTDYLASNIGAENRLYLYPEVDFNWKPADAFGLFVNAEGDIKNNGLRATVKNNPYVNRGIVTESNFTYSLSAGIQGDVAAGFGYRLMASYRGENGYQSPYVLYHDSSADSLFDYMMVGTDFDVYQFGALIYGYLGGGFSYDLEMNFRDIQLDKGFVATWLPEYDMNFGLKYNYQDRLRLSLDATILGRREFTALLLSASDGGVPQTPRIVDESAFDLGLSADYRLQSNLWLFLNISNLTGDELYHHPLYNSVGVKALAGVKVRF